MYFLSPLKHNCFTACNLPNTNLICWTDVRHYGSEQALTWGTVWINGLPYFHENVRNEVDK